MPLVSVVIIFLNEERFLRESVQSVLDQRHSDWELILVDDGSTDQSTTIAQQLADADTRIRYVNHPGHENRGMSASRNLGVAHASAPYLSFLDADDVWVPGKLAEQVALLEDMPDVAMVCGATLYWYSWDEASPREDRKVPPGGISDERLDPPEVALALYPLKRGTDGPSDMMVRRSAFDAVGGFENQFRGLYEDQAYYLKVFLRYPVFISSKTWVFYRQHDASCCGQTTKAEARRRRVEFLDWLEELGAGGFFEDDRISNAIRRRRRELIFSIPAAHVVDRLNRLPRARDTANQWVKRVAKGEERRVQWR